MGNLLQYRDHECLKDSDGNTYEVNYVRYNTSRGYDEVIQLKINGTEAGHITWHYDENGTLLQVNEHGNTNIPSGVRPC
jgi:hypothetical protein